MVGQISKQRKLNEVLTRELAEYGWVRVTPVETQNVLDEKGRRIRELTSVVQKRFKFLDNGVELHAKEVNDRGLCAIAQAESLRYKLLGRLAIRRFVIESGAKGFDWSLVLLRLQLR